MTIIREQDKKVESTAAVVSMVLSVVIFLITLAAGIVSDSIALLLDASMGFIIVFMAFMLRFSIQKIHMPPDQFFNFGYEKFEPFTAVIQGIAIVLSCVFSSYFAIQDIVHAEDIVRYDIPMYVSLFSGTVALLNAFFLRRISRATHSTVLQVSSLHWLMDGSLSFAMCAGFLFGFMMHRLGYFHITHYVDPVMALVLACFFIGMPLKLIRHNVRELLDATPSREVRSEIETIVEKHKARSFGIRSIRMRRAGEKVFLNVCFEIYGHTTMVQAQEFAESFEKDIAAHFPRYDVIVYFYPKSS
ncbi:MAG: cation diffusion facilitator family transporter [Candidatus Omnitrophica bacterium]|nr:cation diffusion facilitator family transporter [Candidatus Omnitrophota bacterium]